MNVHADLRQWGVQLHRGPGVGVRWCVPPAPGFRPEWFEHAAVFGEILGAHIVAERSGEFRHEHVHLVAFRLQVLEEPAKVVGNGGVEVFGAFPVEDVGDPLVDERRFLCSNSAV